MHARRESGTAVHIVTGLLNKLRPLTKRRMLYRRCMETNWFPHLWGQWWSHCNHPLPSDSTDRAVQESIKSLSDPKTSAVATELPNSSMTVQRFLCNVMAQEPASLNNMYLLYIQERFLNQVKSFEITFRFKSNPQSLLNSTSPLRSLGPKSQIPQVSRLNPPYIRIFSALSC